NVVPLESYELTTAWELLRKKYPNQFLATPSEIAAWYRSEVRDSEAEGLPAAASFHFNQAKAQSQLQPVPAGDQGKLAQTKQLLSIPPRDPRASDDQIDLSSYYNLGLHESLNQKPDGKNLSALPDGLHEFGGVLFDVRGLIQLMGQRLKEEGQSFPESVNGIRVGRKCKRLHLLHAALYCQSEIEGVQIGSYFLNYADGQRIELPIVAGEDIADWFMFGPSTHVDRLTPVWTASNPTDARGVFALYKTTKKSPRPDAFVLSVDFV